MRIADMGNHLALASLKPKHKKCQCWKWSSFNSVEPWKPLRALVIYVTTGSPHSHEQFNLTFTVIVHSIYRILYRSSRLSSYPRLPIGSYLHQIFKSSMTVKYTVDSLIRSFIQSQPWTCTRTLNLCSKNYFQGPTTWCKVNINTFIHDYRGSK